MDVWMWRHSHTLEANLKSSVFRVFYSVWTSAWTHDVILHRNWWCHAFKTRVNGKSKLPYCEPATIFLNKLLYEKLPFEVGKIFATVEIVVLCVRFDAFICSIGIFNELPCLFIELNLSVLRPYQGYWEDWRLWQGFLKILDYGLVEESEDTIFGIVKNLRL